MITTSPAVNHTPYPISPDTTPQTVETPEAQTVVRNKRGIANKSRLWPQNKTVAISFMDVPEREKALIKAAIESMAPFVNLKFKFVDGESDGDIRISSYKGFGGNWSELGTNAQNILPDEPTMNIDIHGADDRTIKWAALHEFGHALGLLHEHKHPQRSFSFNTAEVYRTFGNAGASAQDVDNNIFGTHDPAHTTQSAYDQKSVMHYQFLAKSTSNNVEIPLNEELSQGDKDFLTSLYPPPSKAKKKWPSAEELIAYRIFVKEAQRQD